MNGCCAEILQPPLLALLGSVARRERGPVRLPKRTPRAARSAQPGHRVDVAGPAQALERDLAQGLERRQLLDAGGDALAHQDPADARGVAEPRDEMLLPMAVSF